MTIISNKINDYGLKTENKNPLNKEIFQISMVIKNKDKIPWSL